MKKIISLNNIIHTTKYSLMRELAKNKKWDIYSLIASGKNEGNWGYKVKPSWHRILLPSIRLPFFLDTFNLYINPTAFFVFAKINPDIIVISGWDLPVYHMAFIYAKIFHKKLILWSGSTKYENNFLRTITLPLVKFIVRNVDAIIVYGKRAKEYCLMLGATDKKIFTGIYAGDTEYYMSASARLISQKSKIRRKYSLPEKNFIFLYVGQLIKRKNLIRLIDAFKGLSNESSLVIVGDGPLKKVLIDKIKIESIPNIYFLGPRNRNELPEMYNLADVFILPSFQEVWGLVVNEAMACSLPVIVSKEAGASGDLVYEGENGYIFDSNNVSQLKNIMHKLLSTPGLAAKMGCQSREIIKNVTPEALAKIFCRVFSFVIVITELIPADIFII